MSQVLRRRRPAAVLMVLAMFVSALISLSATEASADPSALTDDKSTVTPTGWWTYTNVTEAQVNAFLSAKGARLTDLEVYSASANTFTVTMVKNTGAYAVPGWWWYHDATFAQVANLLSTNNARLIDIEAYNDGGVIRYAVVMVSNTGGAARNWSWLAGVSSTTIGNHLSNTGGRLIDLESYVEGGVKKYAMIAVANTGADAKPWQWWLNQSAASVTEKVNSFGGRITNLERQADGTYNFIQVSNAGVDNHYWRYYFGLTSLGAANNVAMQYGTRIFDIETYTVNGQRRFDVVMIDNSNAPTRRITNIFSPAFTGSNGLPTASFGAYVKQVGGPVATALQSDRQFEPASLVKTIHNLHIMRQVQAGERLSSNFVYYNYPNSPFNAGTSNACPIPSDEVAANQINSTLDFGKDRMMTISDNRTTRGITLRYGLPAINATAQWAGMASTDVDQDQVGCGWLGGKRNDTTLSDIGRLFEGVENGTFLGTGSFRTEFYQPMTGNAFNTTSGVENNIITVVNEEAAKQGKSAIADDFVAGMNWRTKGGSYSIPCDQAGCAIGSIYVRSLGGRLTLPTKTSATTFGERDYVFGRFVNDLRINCTECPPQAPADAALVQVDKELFREVIASALQSW